MERQKVVLRFIDGRIVRGYLGDFSVFDSSVSIEDDSSVKQTIPVHELKAVFFVRSFEGDKSRNERKSFIGPVPQGKRVFVRFKDGESMMGYIEGDMPWQKGFFLEPKRGTEDPQRAPKHAQRALMRQRRWPGTPGRSPTCCMSCTLHHRPSWCGENRAAAMWPISRAMNRS